MFIDLDKIELNCNLKRFKVFELDKKFGRTQIRTKPFKYIHVRFEQKIVRFLPNQIKNMLS